MCLAVAAGCSGGEKWAAPGPAATTGPPPTEATTTTTLPPLYPLSGRPATDPAVLRRPAVTLKIDNIAVARPQAGIESADVVYEELTEGITRLVVVFQSSTAEVIGPVRSVRPADPVIVTPLGGVLAFSGGSPAAVALATDSPVTVVTEGATDVMYRRRGRSAPHNLYTSGDGLYGKAPPEAGAPPAFADFLRDGLAFAPAGSTPVAHLSLVPAPYVSVDYDWDAPSATWRRTTDGRPHLLENGAQIAPTTVIVQYTPYSVFVHDAKVQYPEVVGAGDALILAGGVMIAAKWSKPAPTDVTVWTDAAGTRIALPPGQTWVHLVAPGSPVTPS